MVCFTYRLYDKVQFSFQQRETEGVLQPLAYPTPQSPWKGLGAGDGGHGNFPNQPTCDLWTWERLMIMVLEVS